MTNPFLATGIELPWDAMTPDELEPAVREGLKRGAERLQEIRDAADSDLSFDNSFLALERALDPLHRAWRFSSHLDGVANSAELRKARQALQPEVTRFFTRVYLDSTIYGKLQAFADSPAAKNLNAVQQRFMKEALADFEESGAHLDDAAKARLEAIEEKLSTVTQSFGDNSLDSLNAYEKIVTDRQELSGLPDSLIEAARDDALKNGKGSDSSPAYRFTLQAPSFMPAMRYLDSDAIRRELYEAFIAVASSEPHDNTQLVRDILELRQEKAKILGKAHFPDLVLSRRMAKSGEQALAFVDDLHRRTLQAFREENAELEAFRAEQSGEKERALYPWEQAYWSEKLRKARYDFDEEELRPYFALPKVLSGLFQVTERLFGIRVRERTDNRPAAWHDEVRYYEIHDVDSGRHLGSFFSDWHPRPSKRGGAWMAGLITGDRGTSETPHLGLVAGNMSRPLGEQPALLTHNEVTTVFHEFGHLIHHLLGEVEIRSLNGTNVAWDFVELPSQLLENWCWERESLDLFARHWQTDEPIPQALFDKMIAARNFQSARFQMRQLSFGKFDLEMHLKPQRFMQGNIDEVIGETIADYLVPSPIPFRSNVRQFAHLFSSSTGYAAGYYSYKWAEVLDADAFSRFLEEGLLNPAPGRAFREAILSKGNSEEPQALFRAFMGRDPDPQALLRRIGL
ncbi:MAG: M3 family metallopeptidase [Opitutales bacterium]|nr:M3 family metallopeptidase [Opitutales bacterium]